MQPPRIDYAPALPGQKRRRMLRRVAFGAIGLVLVVLAIKSAPPAWRHVQILYWQHQAMKYAAPADRIVYDDDPTEAARLGAADHSLVAGGHGEVFQFVRPWEHFYQLVSPPGRTPAATLFLHELTNATGERRLVAIELRPLNSMLDPSDAYQVFLDRFELMIFEPGGFMRNPQQKSAPFPQTEVTAVQTWHRKTTWFAGQPDPKDPSHFTIRGVRDGVPVKVDGWLRNDWVELEVVPN